MKAVNLIPTESAGPRQGGAAAYALLGLLGLLVVVSALWTLAGKSVDDKRAELAAVTAQAEASEAKAGDMQSFTEFSNKRKARVETIKGLVDSRFDWAYGLREVARTLPSGSWATSLRASVSPATSVEGATDPLRAALAAPAIEMIGCATGQDGVAQTMASLRRIAGVERVSLSSAQKSDDSDDAAGASDSTSSEAQDGCGTHSQFSLTVFFEAKDSTAAQSATAAQPANAATTGASTP